ncbi:MAG: sarcosine oxidase subunit delta [Euzebya sp.]
MAVLVISCPHCGPRNDEEFTFMGEVVMRPAPTSDPVQWRRYLYQRDNVAGVQSERWFHVQGCRRHLLVHRDTTTNEISSVTAAGGRS